MAFLSITRLSLRSFKDLPRFMRANEACVKSLRQSEGLIAGSELIDKGLTFWTLTLWRDQEAMMRFRNGEPHRYAMQQLPHWCHEASYHHWQTEEAQLPDWDTASSRLLAEGKTTKVRNPSQNHIAGTFPPIKWRAMKRVLKRS